MFRWTPGRIVRDRLGQLIWCVPAGHFHTVWLPAVRIGDQPALRSCFTICRVGASLITIMF